MTRLYDLMEHWSEVMETGATPPVDFYPFLKWIPERFLGNWVSRATQVKNEMDSLYGDTVRHVIKRQEEKGPKDSFMDRVLEKKDKLGLSMHELCFLGGVTMEGGSDTSSSVIISFIQAMTRWPEYQKKAQAEIDAVIGEDRTPRWSDYSRLPYVGTIIKESMRWRPVAPLGFPHCLAEGMVEMSTSKQNNTILTPHLICRYVDRWKIPAQRHRGLDQRLGSPSRRNKIPYP
jgi:cytochrome P450